MVNRQRWGGDVMGLLMEIWGSTLGMGYHEISILWLYNLYIKYDIMGYIYIYMIYRCGYIHIYICI